MKSSDSIAYLVNTGWNGKGNRISLKDTRKIIDNILNNNIDYISTTKIPIFGLSIPTSLVSLA